MGSFWALPSTWDEAYSPEFGKTLENMALTLRNLPPF